MHLTDAGKIFVVCTLVFGGLSYGWAVRMVSRQNQGKPDAGRTAVAYGEGPRADAEKDKSSARRVAVGYWTLVNFCLLSLFVPLCWWASSESLMFLMYPAQKATVVSYTSYRTTCTDSSNRGAYSCDKYIAMLEITPAKGTPLVLPTDIQSSDPPTVGEVISVIYRPGDTQLHERSLRSMGLLAGALVMLVLMGYVLYLIAAYSVGRDIDRAVAMGRNVVVYGLLPLMMPIVAMALLLIPYRYFTTSNADDFSVWEVGLASFFSLGLLLASIGYVRMMIADKKASDKKAAK